MISQGGEKARGRKDGRKGKEERRGKQRETKKKTLPFTAQHNGRCEGCELKVLHNGVMILLINLHVR